MATDGAYICTRQGKTAVYHYYGSVRDARRNLREQIVDLVALGEKWAKGSVDYYRRDDGKVMEVFRE